MVTTSIGAQENFLGGGGGGVGGSRAKIATVDININIMPLWRHYDDYDVMTINIMPLVHLFLPTL